MDLSAVVEEVRLFMSHHAKIELQRALVAVLALSTSVGITVGPALAQGLPDVHKGKIERPLKSLIRGDGTTVYEFQEPVAAPVPMVGRADMGKMGIESPTKRLIIKSVIKGGKALSGAEISLPVPEQRVVTTKPAPRLPELEDESLRSSKVKPGLVVWHSTFQKAMAASARSGKPVFLFHMMGRLDDRFC